MKIKGSGLSSYSLNSGMGHLQRSHISDFSGPTSHALSVLRFLGACPLGIPPLGKVPFSSEKMGSLHTQLSVLC